MFENDIFDSNRDILLDGKIIKGGLIDKTTGLYSKKLEEEHLEGLIKELTGEGKATSKVKDRNYYINLKKQGKEVYEKQYKEELTLLVERCCERELNKIHKYLKEALTIGLRVDSNISGNFLNIKLDEVPFYMISSGYGSCHKDLELIHIDLENGVTDYQDFFMVYLVDYLINVCGINCSGHRKESDIGKLLGNRFCLTIPLDQFKGE